VFTADGALGPLETAEQRELVSVAMLALMERLNPAERAAFVLREAFAYSHAEIADLLDTSEANARQMHRRARQRLDRATPRFRPDPALWRALVERFLDAARGGDVSALVAMLADNARSTADGGGQVGAARRPVFGRDRVARYLAGAFSRPIADVRLDFDAEINGEPAVLGFVGSTLAGVLFFEIDGDVVTELRVVANPDKLRFLGAQLSHPVGLSGS
jgi:RNA polymerase sigma-70 factor (ECF subfamily)